MKLMILTAAALVAGSAIEPPATPPPPAVTQGQTPDVIYVPTPPEVVEAMLDMVALRDGDVLYDLGSGDGRIPIAAAKRRQVRATGIDIDPQRIREARANAAAAGVSDAVTFKQADLFTSDFSDASVVTLYLLDTLNEKLRPKLLAELKPGTRIVSHAFRMGDWAPEKQQTINGRTIYFWTVPPRN
ncbi:class I SAM-dependent methyltransferase [Sphingomonas sp. ST-64]|uniref:Class I SAM-dependent methyltransferase n=1 Tax=Sphingomonas plantiphila TaxID=3163295 RepID=A0ABW8YPW6_9SPHN